MQRIFAIVFFSLCILASHARADEEECRDALIETVDPSGASVKVTSQSGDATQSLERKEGDTFGVSQTISTDANTSVDLRLCDGSVVRLDANSSYTFTEASEDNGLWGWTFSLLQGSLRAMITPSTQKDVVKFRIQTAGAAMGVRGTEFVVEQPQGNGQETKLYTTDGEVLMGRPDQMEELRHARGATAFANFQPVKKDTMSSMHPGLQHPVAPKAFDRSKLSQRLYSRNLEKKQPQEVRQRLQQARQQRAENRTLFDRNTRTLEKVEDVPHRAEEQDASSSSARAQKNAQKYNKSKNREKLVKKHPKFPKEDQ